MALIPAYNEEQTIAKVIIGCERYCNQVIVCDDGSKDHTARIARRLGAEVILSEENEGKGGAMTKLFSRAIEIGADIAITIDADGQHNPDDIPRLIAVLGEGYDMVVGRRTGKIPVVRAVGNALINPKGEFDTQSGFRVYKGSALPLVMPKEKGISFDSETFNNATENGLSVGQTDITVSYDVPNPSKGGILHGPEVWWTMVKFRIIKKPLLYFAAPGLILISLSFFFMLQGFQYIVTEGLGSIFLGIIGFYFLSTGVSVWILLTIIRRERK